MPAPAAAQTQFVPYFGKNQVHYDKFDWHIYQTDHFEIYYYPELEPHLERVASYAESAYQHISADLKHDLACRVPMVLFKTESEFQEQQHLRRRDCRRACSPSPSPSATGWSCRSTKPPTSSTSSSRTS